jgi:upstream activation factor subunit UAF30
VNEIILSQYYDLVDKRKDEEKSEKERLKEIERQDALLAAKLSKGAQSGPIMRARATNKRKQTKASTGERKNSPFNREMLLSYELCQVLGTAQLSRPQVVKQLWSYIKDNNLQNPSDKRQIMCDDKLQAVFKKKLVGAFEMNKILSLHLFKPEDVDQSTNLVRYDGNTSPSVSVTHTPSPPPSLSPAAKVESSESEAE